MTKRILTAAAAAALLVPALAVAEVVIVNGEAGMIFKDAPSTLTRDEVRAQLNSAKTIGDAHFKYVGGEAGWMHESPTHRMLVENGKLVHASDCPVMASMSAPRATPTGSIDLVYTGA
jgi:hypothetical protein